MLFIDAQKHKYKDASCCIRKLGVVLGSWYSETRTLSFRDQEERRWKLMTYINKLETNPQEIPKES